MKKILFVSYGAGHVNCAAPVYAKLLENKNVECSYLACTTAMNASVFMNNEYLSYGKLLPLLFQGKEEQKIRDHGVRLSQEYATGGAIPYEETLAYMGINYYELEQEFGETIAKEMYLKDGRKIFSPIQFAKKVLEYIEPDLVITTTSPRTEYAFIKACNDLGTKSICLTDLYIDSSVKELFSKSWYGSRICTFPGNVDNFVEHGRKRSDVIGTGNPAFDYLYSLDMDKVGKYKQQFSDKPLLVFIKSPTGIFDELEDQMLLKLISFSKQYNFELIIRHHPNDNDRLCETHDFSLCDDVELSVVLGAVDIVVTVISTVGCEAAILSKYVLQVITSNMKPGINFSEMKIGRTAMIDGSFEEDIAFYIEECGKQVGKESSTLPDKKATDKVIDLVFKMIEEN